MFRKFICAVLLVLLMSICLTGCGMGIGGEVLKEFAEFAEIENGFLEEWKDNKEGIKQELYEFVDGLLEEINDWSDSVAAYSVTGDNSLVGERKQGDDNYVGSYEADYDKFTGEEYIFGGTSLKRTGGSDLKVNYSLTVQSGTVALYWLDGEEKKPIADAPAQDTYTFSIHAGGNFIVLEGDNFTGSLSLEVE